MKFQPIPLSLWLCDKRKKQSWGSVRVSYLAKQVECVQPEGWEWAADKILCYECKIENKGV